MWFQIIKGPDPLKYPIFGFWIWTVRYGFIAQDCLEIWIRRSGCVRFTLGDCHGFESNGSDLKLKNWVTLDLNSIIKPLSSLSLPIQNRKINREKSKKKKRFFFYIDYYLIVCLIGNPILYDFEWLMQLELNWSGLIAIR